MRPWGDIDHSPPSTREVKKGKWNVKVKSTPEAVKAQKGRRRITLLFNLNDRRGLLVNATPRPL
jgi:hypothetical protein